MPNIPDPFRLALPEAPDTTVLESAIHTRLAVIVHLAMPSARAAVAFLRFVWGTTALTAVPLFGDPEGPMLCAPAGAERLATTAATLASLEYERDALLDLQGALEVYDAGGQRMVDDLSDDPDLGDAGNGAIPRCQDAGSCDPRSPNACWLQAYLVTIRQERACAEAAGDTLLLAQLDVERDGVLSYIRRRLERRREEIGAQAWRSPKGPSSRRVA